MSDPPQKRPARQMRQITPLLRDAAPLLMLASALFYTNRWLALTDDDTSTLSAAAPIGLSSAFYLWFCSIPMISVGRCWFSLVLIIGGESPRAKIPKAILRKASGPK